MERCESHGEFELRIGNTEKDIEHVEKRVDKIDGRIVNLEKYRELENQKSDMLFQNVMKAIADLSDSEKAYPTSDSQAL